MTEPLIKYPTRMWPKGQKFAEYDEIIPAGVPKSAVLTREYWKNCEGQLRQFDEITCVAADGSFDMVIRLIEKTATKFTFRILHDAPIGEAYIVESNESDRFVVQQEGRKGLWLIREKSGGKVVSTGHGSKADAEAERARIEASVDEDLRQVA